MHTQMMSPNRDIKNRALLIDGSSLTVQMFYALGGSDVLKEVEEALRGLPSTEAAPAQLQSLLEKSVDETLIRINNRVKFDRFTHTRIALENPFSNRCFRYDIYADYKGAITQKRPRVASAIQEMLFYKANQQGIDCGYIDHYEADDVLSVMTHKLLEIGWLDHSTIHLWSLDTDIHQLVVGEGIYILGNKGVELSYEDVKNRWRMEPTAIPWIKALAGDASDNIKGFPGIGPKKAVEYLRYVPHRKPTPWTLDMEKIPKDTIPGIMHLHPRLVRDELLCTLRKKGKISDDYENYVHKVPIRGEYG